MDDYTNNKTTSAAKIVPIANAAIINIDFSNNDINTIEIEQDTIINVIGSFYNSDIKTIIVSGDYTITFVQSGFIFKGKIDATGLLSAYNGTFENIIQVDCIHKQINKFWVSCVNSQV